MRIFLPGETIMMGPSDFPGPFISGIASQFDPDAAAFFDEGVLLGEAPLSDPEKTAINTYVLTKKADGIWTQCLADYPFVGGTPVWHSLNLRNPSTFRITWSGTVTHDANGITGNGSDGYGNTGLNFLSDTAANDLAFGVYNRTSGDFASREIGTDTLASGDNGGIYVRFLDATSYFDNNEGVGRCSAIGTNALGLFTSSRTAANAHNGYRNATSIASTTNGQGTRANSNFTLLRGAQIFYSTRNLCFAFVSAGLTGANITALYAAVQALQTSLGRQV